MVQSVGRLNNVAFQHVIEAVIALLRPAGSR
jgi:hypothetical protein